MPLSRPDIVTLRNRAIGDIEAAVPQTTPVLDKSVLHAIGNSQAGTAHSLYGFAVYIARQISVITAEGEWLDQKAAEWGIVRQAAGFAGGSISFVASAGSVISAGNVITGPNGFEYTVNADATASGGSVTVVVSSKKSGASGNLTAGRQVTLVSPIPGVANPGTVVAPGILGGSPAESDESLRSRVLDRIRNPPSGGTKKDYERWAREVDGVTRAWCTENINGAGTVGVTFVMDGSTPILPPEAKLDEVKAHIETQRPLCVVVYVLAPEIFPIDMTIGITPDTAALRALVSESLSDYIADSGSPGSKLYLSRLREAVSSTPGVVDSVIYAPTTDITLSAAQIGELGTITWS